MKDNVNNFYGTAPDRGRQKGPVLGSLNATTHGLMEASDNTDDYWLSSMGSAGVVGDERPPHRRPKMLTSLE